MKTVFYSWQSDYSKSRNIVKSALNKAVKSCNNNPEVVEPARVDSDTKGIDGSPDIVSAILSKIDACDIFVADVSIVGRISTEGRFVINQNVAYELGYAQGCSKSESMILLFDKNSGSVNDLPFDIRNRRILQFDSSKGVSKLCAQLVEIIKPMLIRNSNDMGDDEYRLDEIGAAIMGVFSKMSDSKRIMVFGTLGGPELAYDHIANTDEHVKILDSFDCAEIIATLEEMAAVGLLKETLSNSNNQIFTLSKEGYRYLRNHSNI